MESAPDEPVQCAVVSMTFYVVFCGIVEIRGGFSLFVFVCENIDS